MSIHDGHRQRMKERFLQQGMDSFTDVQALEMMLFYCIPRQDTNEMAHRLLKHFGSFHQVLEADVEALIQIEGIGINAATYLKMLLSTARFYTLDRCRSRSKILSTMGDCGQYLVPYFLGKLEESVFVLCLDAKCKVLSCRQVAEGGINSAGIPVRRVVEVALNDKASSVVLAHNHPSGIALPSEEDFAATKRVADALEAIEVTLAEHFIICDDCYYSIKERMHQRPFGR